MYRHLRSVAIMIEVTSRHMECTHVNLDYSRMPAVAQQFLSHINVSKELIIGSYSRFITLSISKMMLEVAFEHRSTAVIEPWSWSQLAGVEHDVIRVMVLTNSAISPRQLIQLILSVELMRRYSLDW